MTVVNIKRKGKKMKMPRCKAKRIEKGWTQAELARHAEMHPASISRIEGGLSVPYESQLQKLSKALGWEGDPSELMEEVEA